MSNIRAFELKDFEEASRIIKDDMHFDTYLKDGEIVDAFCHVNLANNLKEATEAYSYILNGKLVGFLITKNVDGKLMYSTTEVDELSKPYFLKLGQHLLTPFVEKYQNHIKEMKKYLPEGQKGEIILFAIDKNFKRHGFGTDLLRELSKNHRLERYYVITDSDCNYQFYEKHHFELCAQGDIDLETEVAPKHLVTFVYSRTLFYSDKPIEDDYLVRANANEQILAWAISSRNLVDHAREIHNLSPICTAALGRSMSAALMMGNNLKNENDTITLQFNGDGPMRGLVVTANNKGEVKGYAKATDVILPPNAAQHLNVGGAIGSGTLTVIRDYGLKDPYVSTVALQTGEIAEDLAFYFASSEQTPSVVALGVLMKKDATVDKAGGIILQLMPNCPEESISKLERNLKKMYALTDLLKEGMSPEDMLDFVLEGFDVKITEKKPVKFQCNCSKERTERVLISIGKKELQKLKDEDHGVTLNCQFCNSAYHFTEEELANLIDSMK